MGHSALFYFIGIYIACGVGIWSVLMAHFGRSKDPFSCLTVMRIPYIVTFILCVGFGVFPLREVLDLVQNHSALMVFGAACSLFAIHLRMKAAKHMPVGTLATISAVCFILGVLGYESLFMNTLPTPHQFAIIGGIILGAVVLISLRNDASLQFVHLPLKGLMAAIVCGLSNGIAFVTMGDVARSANPFITAVLYNLYIGVLVVVVQAVRQRVLKTSFDTFDTKSFLGVCATACIGMTVAFGFAYGSTLGSVTVLAGLESSSIVIASLISWFFLKEKLSCNQWSAIVFVTVCIVLLKFQR